MTNTNVQTLKKGRNNVILTGKLVINENSFSGEKTSDRTGYKYKQVRLGVQIAEGHVVWAEMMGGYSPKAPKIFAMDKDNNAFDIAWQDRKNEKILENVANYKFQKCGLTRDEQGQLIIEQFLSPWDMHDYLELHAQNNMEITIRGTYQFSEYNGNVQRKIQIGNVFLPFQRNEFDENGKPTGNKLPVQYEAKAELAVILDEDSLQKITKEEKEAGEFTVSAYAVDYVNKKDGKEFKKNVPFPLAITVPITETVGKVAEKLFKVKKGKVRELSLEMAIVEGYDQVKVTKKDITPDMQELIDLGCYTEEQILGKMTVKGNKVSKLVYIRPFVKKDDNGKLMMEIDDEKYTMEDLIVEEPQEEKEIDLGIDDTAKDLLGDTSIGGSDDDAFLGDLLGSL